MQEKINAVKRAPLPCNVSELRSFLGTVQYHSFLPGLATTLKPLRMLNLQKRVQWEWNEDCQKACKDGLTSDFVLVHYNLNRELRLAFDASS